MVLRWRVRTPIFSLLYSEIMQPVGLTLPTLLIVNEGTERFRIYGAVGLLGSVYPGETKCVTLDREGEQVLGIRGMRESEITPIFSGSWAGLGNISRSRS